jgi:hypothetical protein
MRRLEQMLELRVPQRKWRRRQAVAGLQAPPEPYSYRMQKAEEVRPKSRCEKIEAVYAIHFPLDISAK